MEGDHFSQESAVPLGHSVATIHLDQVGIKSLIFNNFASFCPLSRLFDCSLVLYHDMVSDVERGEGFGAV